MAVQNPVVVLPGITASVLRDEYPVNPEVVWTVLSKSYDRVALHPDDVRWERDEPARVVADQAFTLPYGELVKEVAHDLSARADEPTPVFPFAYDWRQPLGVVERQLDAFVDEVIERTCLLKHYYRAGYHEDPKVDLVGHSMGGLVLSGWLKGKGADARVGKVATLATPFRGSFEAVMKVTTGLAELGGSSSSSREREVARLTPALYYLLPSFPGALQVDEGLPDTFYDVDLWQASILETLSEYIRLYGRESRTSKAERLDKAHTLLTTILSEAREHRDRVESLEPEAVGMDPDDWLCVVGLGETTRVQLRVEERDAGPVFDLTSADRRNGYPAGRVDDRGRNVPPTETGDGTVPYEGARPAFLGPEKLVCVTDDDFGYWELRDRALEGAGVGLHGMLPSMNLAHRLVAAHFKAGPGHRARGDRSLWGRSAPGIDPENWDPPIRDLRRKGA